MEWISIKKELPIEGEKVKYKMLKKTGLFKKEIIEDIGWFQNGEFLTFDEIGIYPITHWKYLEKTLT
jgi:hypothetical protein